MLERLIDNAANYLNAQANLNINVMTGTAGSKTVVLPRSQETALKTVAALLLRGYLDRGPNVGLGGLSVTSIINDPQYQFYVETLKTELSRLQMLSPVNVELLIDSAIGYLNSQTCMVQSLLSGSTGNKSVSLPGSYASQVKLIAGLMLRVVLSRGNASGLNLQNVISDPEHAVIGELIKTGIAKLKSLSAVNTEYILDKAVRLTNLHSETAIAALSGTAGSKVLVGSENEVAVVMAVAGYMLKDAVADNDVSQKNSLFINSLFNKLRASSARAPILVANEPIEY